MREANYSPPRFVKNARILVRRRWPSEREKSFLLIFTQIRLNEEIDMMRRIEVQMIFSGESSVLSREHSFFNRYFMRYGGASLETGCLSKNDVSDSLYSSSFEACI